MGSPEVLLPNQNEYYDQHDKHEPQGFRKLTQSQQEAIMKASEEVEEYLWQLARQEEEANLKVCEEHGCTIMTVDQGMQDELKKLGEEVSREWIEKNPKAKPLFEKFWNKYNS